MSAVVLGAAFVGGASAVHGCTIMNGLTVPEVEDFDADVVDVPDVVGDETKNDPTDPCEHALVPDDKPNITDTGLLSFTTATRDIDLGVAAADAGTPKYQGYDLDQTCTCFPAEASCTSPNGRVCDDEHGRDNSFSDVIRQLESKGITAQELVTSGLASGANALLFIVEQYNGEEDDARVSVTIASSPGLRDKLPDGGITETRTPTWTREDEWLLVESEFYDTVDLRVGKQSYVGYVRGGQLVAKITNASLPLGSSNAGLVVRITNGVLTGTIAQDDDSFYLKTGQIAGRWSVHDALTKAWTMAFGVGTLPFCKQPFSFFELLKNAMCEAVDIMADPARDNQADACDALSLAIGFEGAPAGLGELFEPPTVDDCEELPPGAADCPR